MTHFTFRLQPLMNLRETERDRRREELADAYRADQILADRHDATLRELEQTKQSSRKKAEPGLIEVDALLHTHRYELILTAQLQQIADQREKIGAEMERRRQALIQADQELRILEKLRDRYLREFRHAEEKAHTREMDEMAQRRHATARGGDRL